MQFNIKVQNDFKNNIRREWALTNGLGGYAGGSVTGAINRTHQGYLIASLHAPVQRYVCFSKTNEKIVTDSHTYDLSSDQFKGGCHTDGIQYIREFTYDGTICFTYEAGDITIKKHIALAQGKNLAAVAYEVQNKGEAAKLLITPLMNFREHSESSTVDSLKFEVQKQEHGFTLIPKAQDDHCIRIAFSGGELIERDDKYICDLEAQTEVDNEVPGLDCAFCPYDVSVDIPAGESMHFSIMCDIVPLEACNDNSGTAFAKHLVSDNESAFKILRAQLDYTDELIKRSGFTDDFAVKLTVAANQFIAHRQSTGYDTVLAGLPWFTDWGRDTMISYTGLTLCTGRFEKAHDILLTFAKYCKDGLIPNMFPDSGLEPLYNTVDASLWYFYAVYKYLEYVATPDAYEFIKKDIYPCLKDIISTYKKGTDFSIYMDTDGLIHAGSGLDQVTWMDVRVGDWVATPRHGKPVEINALWYNALCTMDMLQAKFGDNDDSYRQLASLVKTSFNKRFWNENTGCLYDVVDEDDDTIRPNQIYAVSLPFTMLDKEREKAIVDTVMDKLYVGCGLRSLDPDHKDYHPIYIGSLSKRDHAYHQGTAWGFLLGGFISAYVKVNGRTKATALCADKLLDPVREHLLNNCIGSICEIFDGDAPHTGRGCYAQAWSVGEVLRCYCEDVLPMLPQAHS